MRFNPTKSGGRILQGKTPYGDFVVEWDAAGQIIRQSLTLRTPDVKRIDVSNIDNRSLQALNTGAESEDGGCSPCEAAARRRWAEQDRAKEAP
jgi:hypothetical protein